MKEILEILRKKGKKFFYAYLVCAAIYILFDYVYMPWLTKVYGYWMFVPLYPSILLANFLGVYLYDFLGEDVLFMEFGSDWISEVGGRLEPIKRIVRKSDKLIFIGLSMYPSPIASYIYFRKEKDEPAGKIFKCIAIGSIYCTMLWGGVFGLAWLAIVNIIRFFR